ncbi:MAG: hypothetical protein ACYDHZ_11180 [Dehalococcoidia bacterium]
METDVASVTFHDSVADPPALIVPGLTAKLPREGGLGLITVIVVDPLAEPDILVAVSVYVVVVAGDTGIVPLDDTVPTSGLMDTPVAPVTSHCKFACCPDVIVGELALKDATTGAVNHLKMLPCVAMLTPTIAAAINSTAIIVIVRPEILFCGNGT